MGVVDLSGGAQLAAPTTGVPTASVLLPPPQLAPMNPLMQVHGGMPVTMQHMVSAAGQVCTAVASNPPAKVCSGGPPALSLISFNLSHMYHSMSQANEWANPHNI